MEKNANDFLRYAVKKRTEGRTTKDIRSVTRNRVDVFLDVDPSLKGWTDNCVFSSANNPLEEKRSIVHSVYCEVLGNKNCTECTRTSLRLSSLKRSLMKYPELETGGYLLFLTVGERQRQSDQRSVALSRSVTAGGAMDSGWQRSPTGAERPHSRNRVRTASDVLTRLNRLASENNKRSPWSSPVPWRPSTPKSVRFETDSPSGQCDLVSRTGMCKSRSNSGRSVSSLSQEGWSAKQKEAWKLLTPTPPQIEVSQMNVSMYTPKELPGIKIFDESLFVI